MSPAKVLIVLGTRPEVVKLAPVYRELRSRGHVFDVRLASTGQHREMLDQALHIFGIRPDYDLDVMTRNQNLYGLTAAILTGMQGVLEDFEPDIVLVQGDTTTTMAGALAAYYKQIAVGHVEAGLRTGNKNSPFPEEVNRLLTGHIADFHFAPTEMARGNLNRENIDDSRIYVTGNTSIDAIKWVISHTEPDFDSSLSPGLADIVASGRFVLITSHRRESFGEPMRNTFRAIARLAKQYQDHGFVFPVHLNPNVREKAREILGGIDNIHLLEPLDYVNFSHLMARSLLILSDSGGIQEEAPSLDKPVLVLRDTTERREGVEAGTAILTGTDPDRIHDEVRRLIEDAEHYSSMTRIENPYGDGKASARIADALEKCVHPPT